MSKKPHKAIVIDMPYLFGPCLKKNVNKENAGLIADAKTLGYKVFLSYSAPEREENARIIQEATHADVIALSPFCQKSPFKTFSQIPETHNICKDKTLYITNSTFSIARMTEEGLTICMAEINYPNGLVNQRPNDPNYIALKKMHSDLRLFAECCPV